MTCPHCAAPLPESVPVSPKRLVELRHHHERHAHFTHAMVSELLQYVDAQAERIAKLSGALESTANVLSVIREAAPRPASESERQAFEWLCEVILQARAILKETP